MVDKRRLTTICKKQGKKHKGNTMISPSLQELLAKYNLDFKELEENIVTPVIYNQEEYYGYGVHKVNGEIYSKRIGVWRQMSFSVSGKSPYPKGYFSVNGERKFIVQHIAVHETLNPNLPVPPGITEKEWKRTPRSVKKMLRHVWQVNHIDHCHTNYRPDNLEWTTAQQNVEAYQNYRLKA